MIVRYKYLEFTGIYKEKFNSEQEALDLEKGEFVDLEITGIKLSVSFIYNSMHFRHFRHSRHSTLLVIAYMRISFSLMGFVYMTARTAISNRTS